MKRTISVYVAMPAVGQIETEMSEKELNTLVKRCSNLSEVEEKLGVKLELVTDSTDYDPEVVTEVENTVLIEDLD